MPGLEFLRGATGAATRSSVGKLRIHHMKRDDLLDLNDVLQHPGRRLEVDISTELQEEGELDLVAPLEGTLDAVSTGNLLLIKGSFRTRAVLECARCGAPLEEEVAFEMDEQFPVEGIPSSYSSQDFARVTSDEPEAMFEGNTLLVEALLRQGVLLSLPLQPLCEHGWEEPCPAEAAIKAKARLEESRPKSPFDKLSQLLESEGETSS